VAEENRKSILADILKRERLTKAFQNDKEAEKHPDSDSVKPSSTETTEKSKNLQKEVESKKASLTYDQTVEELLMDIRFYFLKEGEYSGKFRNLYMENKSSLDRYGIDARRFLDYARESFERFKKVKNLMPLEPMKSKSYEYVEKSIRELIQAFAQKFGK